MTMRETVHEFLEALNQREFEKVMGYFAADSRVDAGPWFDQPLVGKVAVRSFLENFLHSLPGLKVNATGVFASRDDAVVTVEVRATMSQLNPDPVHIEEWRGGRKLVWNGAFVISFTADRKMHGFRIFGDSSDLRWVPRESPTA
ncbi:MAG TPA: nuclear transport factor 2 family protein [Thermoplasmata archaeon]|nr:nuclear transport factor 2 family protein [Thermoplasmata archaeon]